MDATVGLSLFPNDMSVAMILLELRHTVKMTI